MWETLLHSWGALLEPLQDPVALAIPAFLLFLILEWTAARTLEHVEPDADGRTRPPRGGYEARDARASISMGLVSIATSAVWKILALVGYAAIWVYLAPWHLPADAWYRWVILLVGVDLLFYWYHRIAHRVRVVWATHQAHHSSEYFNFATALRQKWNNSGEILMWIPLPLLGVPPWMVFVGFSVNLVYQFFVHTERVRTLPRPIEFVFNTPSHHRTGGHLQRLGSADPRIPVDRAGLAVRVVVARQARLHVRAARLGTGPRPVRCGQLFAKLTRKSTLPRSSTVTNPRLGASTPKSDQVTGTLPDATSSAPVRSTSTSTVTGSDRSFSVSVPVTGSVAVVPSVGTPDRSTGSARTNVAVG